MIAHVNVGLSLPEMFTAMKTITDECQHTEGPRPKEKEKIADTTRALTEKERQNNPRQVKQHETRKYEKYPKNVKGAGNGAYGLQRSGLFDDFRNAEIVLIFLWRVGKRPVVGKVFEDLVFAKHIDLV